nr:hypothetical protein [uncultured Rhodopila sp.]
MSPFIWFLGQDPTAAALVDGLMRVPPHAVLYGIASVAHLLRWHRLIPWIYFGLTLASLPLP